VTSFLVRRAYRRRGFGRESQIEIQAVRVNMKKSVSSTRSVDRRSFMKNGLLAGSAATVGVGLLANTASAQERGRLNPGDTAILRFLAAAELIEADLWTQYAELGASARTSRLE
jgi:hypothetical protein